MKYDVRPLVRARQLRGITRTELAALVGRSESMIWRIEKGERGGEATIFAMAKALDVPMSALLPKERKHA